MPSFDADEYIKRILMKYLVAPVIVVVGMLVVGTIIDSQLHTSNAFKIILTAGGGLGMIGLYFYQFWKGRD